MEQKSIWGCIMGQQYLETLDDVRSKSAIKTIEQIRNAFRQQIGVFVSNEVYSQVLKLKKNR